MVEFSTVVWNREHLLELVETWPDALVMLQEYIPRETAEDWIYHAYLDRSADAAVGFTGVKYRSWPPRAGVTSYARIVANPALAELSADLCKRIGFRGIVDLDWRYDRRDQQYKLLDFNPRVGAQFRLFETTAGIDVVRAMHLDLTGRPIPRGTQVTGRGFSVEILDAPARVAAHVLEPGPVVVPHASGPIEAGWFARDDLLPFVMATLRASAPLAARVRQLARDAVRRAQTATARPRAGTAAPIRRAANSAPWTNRMSGPNVGAAEIPLKYSPGTDDSNEASSNGAAATRRHDAAQVLGQEAEGLQPHPVAGRREHVVDLDRVGPVRARRQRESHAPARERDGRPHHHVGADVDVTLDPAAEPPCARRPEHVLHRARAGPWPAGSAPPGARRSCCGPTSRTPTPTAA